MTRASASFHPAEIRRADLLALRADAASLQTELGARSQRVLAGEVRSRRPGEGTDFETSRLYQAGDDIRRVDWRVTARRGTPYTKVFNAEHGRAVIFVVDLGASMAFGTRCLFKRVLAARAAALLAWVAVVRGDRVGAVIAAASGAAVLEPRGGAAAVMALARALARAEVAAAPEDLPPGSLGGALRPAARLARAGSSVVILSDFRGLDPRARQRIRGLGRRARLTLGYVFDPAEIELPGPERFRFSDGTDTFTLRGDAQADRDRLRRRAEQHRASLSSLTPGAALLELSTDRPLLDALRAHPDFTRARW